MAGPGAVERTRSGRTRNSRYTKPQEAGGGVEGPALRALLAAGWVQAA